jgi:hypothetical protein
MISDTLFDTAYTIDISLSEPRLAHLRPRGELLDTILKVRDEALLVSQVIDRKGPFGRYSTMPSAEVQAAMLEDITVERLKDYDRIARTGQVLDEEELRDKQQVGINERLVANIEANGIRSVFADGVDQLEEYLQDPEYDYLTGELRDEIVRVRDMLKLLQILTSTAGGYYNGPINAEKIGPWLHTIAQGRMERELVNKRNAEARARSAKALA